MANWKAVADQWPPLIAEVSERMTRGVPADALELQPLAARWMTLMGQWMDGNYDLIVCARARSAERGRRSAPSSWQGRDHAGHRPRAAPGYRNR